MGEVLYHHMETGKGRLRHNRYTKILQVLVWLALLLFLGLVISSYLTLKHWPRQQKTISTLEKSPHRNQKTSEINPWDVLKSKTFFEFDEVPPNWRLNFSSQWPSSAGYEFKPVYHRGTFTLTDICIEDTPPDWKNVTFEVPEILANGSLHYKRVDMPTKHLVGYNAIFNCNIKIKVSAGPNIKDSDKTWWISFVRNPIPKDRHVVTDHTAFFVLPTCEGNLHHFWQDSTFGLYGAMKATHRLNSTVKNQLFYQQPLWDLDRADGCHNPARYQDFLQTFSIRPDHESYHKKPHGYCYNHAVFGTYMDGFWAGEPEAYIIEKMGGGYSRCSHPNLVIIQRGNRQLLNAKDLLTAAKTLGIENSHVILFEDLSLTEQVRQISCADILVGIQGAGLQWLRFMRAGGGLLELAWPRLGWGYYYQELANFARLEYEAMETQDVFLNFTTYSIQVRHGQPISEKERLYLKGNPPKNSYDNHWKWADVKVDPAAFRTKLSGLLSSVKKNRDWKRSL